MNLSLEELEQRLEDPDPEVRYAAISESDEFTEAAIPKLVKIATSDPDEENRYEALWAICRIGGPESVAPLVPKQALSS